MKICLEQRKFLGNSKIFIIGSLIISAFIVLTIVSIIPTNDPWSVVGLLIGVWIALWYANETFILRKTAQEQNRLMVLPILKIQLCDPGKLDSEGGRVLLVINEGMGPALNININPVKIDQYSIEFPIIASIKHGEVAKIFLEDIQTNPEVSTNHTLKRFLLDIRQHQNKFNLRVTFYDIFNIKREALFPANKISKEGFVIKLPQKEL